MKTILIDRNVIATIRQKLNNQKILPFRDRELRKLDRKNNFISPLLSIREGQSGIKENKLQTKKTTNEEAVLLSRFFKRAKTDSKFLLENQDMLADAFGNNTELKWNSYISFLSEMNDILFQHISKKEKIKYQKIIINKALEYNIDLGHPIVMCCFSVLYGCDNSRGILKFKLNLTESEKKKNLYNALNDLMIISRLSMIKALAKEANKKEKIEYFTFDNKLKKFINSIKFVDKGITENDTEIQATYSHRIFPDLSENEFDIFKNELQNTINKHNKSLEKETRE